MPVINHGRFIYKSYILFEIEKNKKVNADNESVFEKLIHSIHRGSTPALYQLLSVKNGVLYR